MKFKFFERMQHFGSAMFVPVTLLPIVGLLLAFIQIFKNPSIVGPLADVVFLQNFLFILEEGSWTVFKQMPIIFALGFPATMSKQAPERAVIVTLVTLISFHYMLHSILTIWGDQLGVDLYQAVGGSSGLAMVASIKTLDMSILGGIMIGYITTMIHNRYFNKSLPDALAFFQGTALVAFISMLSVLPLAIITAIVWPKIQLAILSLQGFFISSGVFGIWLYTLLERILIPTGLHHFIYTPFVFGSAVVEEGAIAHWIKNIPILAHTAGNLRELIPSAGFLLHGSTKIFGLPGAAIAFYLTAKPENRQKTLGLIIPAALTSFLTGITEPIEFTFLFVSPLLFIIHAILSASMAALYYALGIVLPSSGAIEAFANFWLPMFPKHTQSVILHVVIGLGWIITYILIFKIIIVKLNLKTPGREDFGEVKLHTKKEYKEQKKINSTTNSKYSTIAQSYLILLGDKENIESVTNCATRLRVTVKDVSKVATTADFKTIGAAGVVIQNNNYQVIIGPTVANIRAEFNILLS